MKKVTVFRQLALYTLIFDIFVQIAMISPIGLIIYKFIFEHSLYNVSLIYFLVHGAFGSLILGVVGFLVIIALYVVAFIALIENEKRLFFVPLLIAIVNLLCSMAFHETPIFSVVGLTYKLLACVVYVLLIVFSRKKLSQS